MVGIWQLVCTDIQILWAHLYTCVCWTLFSRDRCTCNCLIFWQILASACRNLIKLCLMQVHIHVHRQIISGASIKWIRFELKAYMTEIAHFWLVPVLTWPNISICISIIQGEWSKQGHGLISTCVCVCIWYILLNNCCIYSLRAIVHIHVVSPVGRS